MTQLADDCIICLDPLSNYAPRGGLRQTPCNHFFHKRCLMGWVKGGTPGGCCPLCNARVMWCETFRVTVQDFEGGRIPAPPRRNPQAHATVVGESSQGLRRSRRLIERQGRLVEGNGAASSEEGRTNFQVTRSVPERLSARSVPHAPVSRTYRRFHPPSFRVSAMSSRARPPTRQTARRSRSPLYAPQASSSAHTRSPPASSSSTST